MVQELLRTWFEAWPKCVVDYINKENKWINIEPDIKDCVCDGIKLVKIIFGTPSSYVVSKCFTRKVLSDLVFKCFTSPQGNGSSCNII